MTKCNSTPASAFRERVTELHNVELIRDTASNFRPSVREFMAFRAMLACRHLHEKRRTGEEKTGRVGVRVYYFNGDITGNRQMFGVFGDY